MKACIAFVKTPECSSLIRNLLIKSLILCRQNWKVWVQTWCLGLYNQWMAKGILVTSSWPSRSLKTSSSGVMNSVREHTWATVSLRFYTGGCSFFPSALLGSFTEEMFEVTSCYFPIDFTPVSPCLLSSRAGDSSDNVVTSSSSVDDISVCMPLEGRLFVRWRKPAVVTVFRYVVSFYVMHITAIKCWKAIQQTSIFTFTQTGFTPIESFDLL